jgi:hypothetical protein
MPIEAVVLITFNLTKLNRARRNFGKYPGLCAVGEINCTALEMRDWIEQQRGGWAF